MFGDFCPITKTVQRWRPQGAPPHPREQPGNSGKEGVKCCDLKTRRNEEQHLFSPRNIKLMKTTPQMKFAADTV